MDQPTPEQEKHIPVSSPETAGRVRAENGTIEARAESQEELQERIKETREKLKELLGRSTPTPQSDAPHQQADITALRTLDSDRQIAELLRFATTHGPIEALRLTDRIQNPDPAFSDRFHDMLVEKIHAGEIAIDS